MKRSVTAATVLLAAACSSNPEVPATTDAAPIDASSMERPQRMPASPDARVGTGSKTEEMSAESPDRSRDSSSSAPIPSDAAIIPQPEVTDVVPPDAQVGLSVEVLGSHFEPNPRIHLQEFGRIIVPTQVSDTKLGFVLPPDLTLSECDARTEIVIANDIGRSSPHPLQISIAAPEIGTPPAASAAAGSTVEWTGKFLTNATASLDGRSLQTRANGSRVQFDVPRDVPLGISQIVIATPCGDAVVPIEILPPVPVLLTVDLATVSRDGVLLVTADLGERRHLREVRLGAVSVKTDAAYLFAWPDSDESSSVKMFAVRMPPDLPAQSFDLLLVGQSGSSNAKRIGYLAADSPRPPPASSIEFLNAREEFAGWVPDVSREARLILSDTGPRAAMRFDFSSGDEDSEDGGTAECSLSSGTVSGEMYQCSCVDCECNLDRCYYENNCRLIEFRGTFRLDASSSLLDFWFTSSGSNEYYVGGWTSTPRAGGVGDHVLVVRSQRTGIQSVIPYPLVPNCR